MCIAIGKMKGVEVPSKEILRTCFENNDDGAGFAFAYDNIVHIKKGYMDFESFWNVFHAYDEKYNFKDLGVLIHFRIATHGNRDASMTHPFPISSDEGALKKIEYLSDYAVVHNGIISLTSTGASRTAGLSDTAIFIKDYLTPISQNQNWFHTKTNIELIYKLIDSKMAILNNNGDIIFTNGFTEDNGVMYSNNTYKENRIRKSYYNYNYNYDNYTGAYGYNNCTPNSQTATSTVTINKTPPFISLCTVRDGIFVQLKNGTKIETSSDEFYKYFFDEKKNLYMGCIDNSISYLEDTFPYYWWQYTKIGSIDKFLMENGTEFQIDFVKDTMAYPEQIISE